MGSMPNRLSENGSTPGPHAPMRVSVVLPCLDEASGVVTAVEEAWQGLRSSALSGQIIVVDNGSMDGSAAAAAAVGATIVSEPRRGYGAAIRRGLQAARGDVIVMADADGSYDLHQLGTLVHRVAQGADIVVGTRLSNRREAGAMPWLHRRVGIPGLNLLLAMATGRWFHDSQSGFRAFKREPMLRLGCTAGGMEYASEMLLLAHRAGLRIEEIPVRYRRRLGVSKLRPVGDGLRHCRLLLRLAVGGRQVTRRTRYRSSS
ncbi:MAG: glycosyl transferase, family 2 [Thermomicrobiales bacterium]|nr:glycosyl transferase, family 2 [Thermomicrobiales bacterium]